MGDILEEVGGRVRLLRREAGLSQAELADSIKMSRAYLGAVERGEKAASVSTLDRLASGIGVPVSSFFVEKEGRTQGHGASPEARIGNLLTALARGATAEDLERFEAVMRGYFGSKGVVRASQSKKRQRRGR